MGAPYIVSSMYFYPMKNGAFLPSWGKKSSKDRRVGFSKMVIFPSCLPPRCSPFWRAALPLVLHVVGWATQPYNKNKGHQRVPGILYILIYIYIYVLIAGEQQEHYWVDPLGRYEILSKFPSKFPRHREMMRAHFQRRDDDTNTNKKGSNLPRSFIAEKKIFPKKSRQGEFFCPVTSFTEIGDSTWFIMEKLTTRCV